MTYQLWAQQKLEEYCFKNNYQFTDLISKNKLSYMFAHSHPDIELSGSDCERLESQEMRYAVFYHCMYELKSVCERCNTKYAFLKGLAIAKDIYYPYQSRKSNDIDILIEKEKVEYVLSQLALLDYKDEDGNCLDIQHLLLHCLNGHHHIDPIYKECTIGDKKIKVCVEVHVFPFEKSFELHGNVDYNFNYAADLLERCEPFNLGGFTVMRPSKNDLALILATHLSTHLFLDLSLYCYVNKPFKKYNIISLTMDIAMFARKYKAEIDWNEVLFFASLNGMEIPVLAVVQIINEIYGPVISYSPPKFVHETNNTPINVLSRVVTDIGIDKYIFSDDYECILRKYLLTKIIIPKYMGAKKTKETIKVESHSTDYKVTVAVRELPNQLVSIIIYNPKVESNHLSMELLLMADEKRNISVYIGKNYNLIWDPHTWGQTKEEELIKAYERVPSKCNNVGQELYVTVCDEDLHRIISSGEYFTEVKHIDKPNPFLSKFQ